MSLDNQTLEKSHSDIYECHVFSLFLLLPLLVEFIAVVTHGGGRLYTITLNIFLLVLSLLLEIRKNNTRECIILFSIYVLFFLNYALVPNNSKFYVETSMLLVYFIYLPIVIFCIRRITSWNYIFEVLKPYCFIAAAISVFIVFYSDVSQFREFFSYMEYSYNVIPFAACSWISFRKYNSIAHFILFLIIFACVILYGSRAALLCLILFVFMFEIYANKGYKRKLLVISSVFLVAVIANIAEFLAYTSLLEDDVFSNSYIVSRLTSGSLFSSDGRDDIYNRSIHYISSIGIEIQGFFGDRPVNNGVWPHNIFLELIMQFGWFIGPVLCMALVYIIIKSLFVKEYFVISLFIIITFLGRYWFSGSYLIEGKFWLSLISLITIINKGRFNAEKSFN